MLPDMCKFLLQGALEACQKCKMEYLFTGGKLGSDPAELAAALSDCSQGFQPSNAPPADGQRQSMLCSYWKNPCKSSQASQLLLSLRCKLAADTSC